MCVCTGLFPRTAAAPCPLFVCVACACYGGMLPMVHLTHVAAVPVTLWLSAYLVSTLSESQQCLE